MKSMNKSIKTRLVFVFTVVILILNTILSFLSIYVVSRNLIEGAHNDLIEIAKEEAKYIQAKRDIELRYIDSLAQNPIISGETSLEEKTAFFKTEAERTGYIQFGIIAKDGNITVFGNNGEAAAKADPEFVQRVMSGESLASDVIVNDGKDQMVIVFAAPVYKNGQQIGVLYGEKDGQMLSDLVSSVSYKKTGFAYMVNDDGTAAGDRNIDLVLNQVNYVEAAKEDSKLRDLSDLMTSKILKREVGSGDYAYEGNDQIIAFAPIDGSPWIVAVGVVTKEVLEEVSGLRNLLIVMTIASIIIGAVIIFYLSGRISNPIKNLAKVADKLAEGDIEVDIAKIAGSKDEIGMLTESFGKMIDNIKDESMAAKRIAAGDLSIDIQVKSEKDVLAISMMSVVDTLRNLVAETTRMTEAAAAGRLDTRGNSAQFEGGYRDIIQGINETLDVVIGPLKVSAEYMDRISKGDIPAKITSEYNGDFNEIKNSINICIDAVNALIEDAVMLSTAAVEGKLQIRADQTRHGGDFAKIIEGVNHTLDAVVKPIYTVAECLDQIGKGEIPQRITEDSQGDFEKMKNSVNACIDGLGALVEGNYILSNIKNNDFSEHISGEYLGIYHEISHSINIVLNNFAEIVDLVNKVAVGNLSGLEGLKSKGKQSDNDELVPSLIIMLESINMLVEEADLLASAAVEGQLNIRGDAAKFKGEYSKVIEGFNRTLDAVIEPVQEASAVLQEMAKGKLDIKMDGDYRGDHAVIKNALNGTIDTLGVYIGEISSVLEEIGRGNLNQTITAEYLGDFVKIKNSLNSIINSLNQVMGDISEAADQVASGSRQVSDGSQALSQGSTEQASAIQELTASLAEITSQTRQNAENASQASTLASSARENAEKGNEHMKAMLGSMEDINESSSDISKIIKVIDDIAFQTNILALNAAVEAARAGQHGKGFAVVAEEVRSLAARSAAAAKETTDLIEGSINKVQDGTKIANETAQALSDIVLGVEKAAGLVEGIAKASNEQASGITQISKGIEQVSQVVQNNSATAEESAAASEELSGQAELLKDMVSQFRLSTNRKGITGEASLYLTEREEEKSNQNPEPVNRIILSDAEFDKY